MEVSAIPEAASSGRGRQRTQYLLAQLPSIVFNYLIPAEGAIQVTVNPLLFVS